MEIPVLLDVTRPDNSDTTVKFKLTVSKGSADGTRTLSITVLKKDNIDKRITFAVKDISIAVGESGIHSLSLNTALSPKDYLLSIEPSDSSRSLPSSMSIYTSGIHIDSDISLADTGTYTVKAVGAGPNYTGEITADFKLTVNKKSLSAVSGFVIEVDNKSVTALTGGQQHKATVKGGLTPGTDYSLSIDKEGNSVAAVDIDNDGTISIDAGIKVSDAGNYTITATGQGNYSATVTETFTLTVDGKALKGDNFPSVQNPVTVTATPFNAQEFSDIVTSTNLTAGTDYTLDITDRPAGANAQAVSISDDGKVSITDAVTVADAGSYTVKATGKENYSGTVMTSFVIAVNTIAISGTLSYADLEVGTGQTKRSNASWNNAVSGQTVRYTLVNPPAGISIDENIGVVTVDAAEVTADTTCSIRAEGIGNYSGEITATLEVFIRDWMPPNLTLTYSDIRVSKGSSASSSPQWSSGGYTVTYDISPLSGGTLPAEISIDPSSGDITVSSAAALQADTVYQVTATGTGRWKGWKKAEIRISVHDGFYYVFQPALVGQPFSLTAHSAPSSVRYSVSPSLPTGLDLDLQTGEISGKPTTRQLATEYTITAAPTGGGSAISNKVYLFIRETASDKAALIKMIDEEDTNQGDTADLGLIDTSKITDMEDLFDRFPSFNGDISSWDVSSVTNMTRMFMDASSFNGDISAWNVSKVTLMSNMFQAASSFNGDISAWDVSNVTSMWMMFYEATAFNGDLSSWNLSSADDLFAMFAEAKSFNGDISSWNVSKVTNFLYGMGSMFEGATAFNGDLSGWNVSTVKNMNNMFNGATAFNGDLSGWNVSSVTAIQAMFISAESFNGDISSWNVSSATNMDSMFQGATAFSGDLSGWDVSSVTTMQNMFYGATAFNGDLSGWDVSSVTTMQNMFYGATAFNGDLELWGTRLRQNVAMSGMFDNSGLKNNTPSWYP